MINFVVIGLLVVAVIFLLHRTDELERRVHRTEWQLDQLKYNVPLADTVAEPLREPGTEWRDGIRPDGSNVEDEHG